MLINLTGKIKNDFIEFDLVNIPLNQNSSVTVIQLCIEYNGIVSNVCGSIHTTLIERSGLNPSQELITFSHTSQVKNLLYTPPHFLWYKIQLGDLKSSVFKISHCERDQTSKISKVNLKLLIHERIFEVNS